MAAGAAILRMGEHRSGTQWEPWYIPIRIQEGPDAEETIPDLTGVYARMQLRDSRGVLVHDWQTANHPGVEAPNGFLGIDTEMSGIWIHGPGVLVAPAGVLVWDLKAWWPVGAAYEPFVDLEGTLPIVQGVTA